MNYSDLKILAENDYYRSENNFNSLIPELTFYPVLGKVIYDGGKLARQGNYDAKQWEMSSYRIFKGLEESGVKFELSGLKNIYSFDGPAVFVSNHMSTLETVVLPFIINPVKKVTFVVKQELLDYPYFGDLLGARDPIVVGRNNPREDLVKVMEEGAEKLSKGISIIIFPQKTRSSKFEPENFNTLGIKLAKKSNAYVVPVALVTDAWGNGKIIKDIGKIDTNKIVHIDFGTPFKVEKNGAEEHQKVLNHIEQKLIEWGREDCIVK